MSVSNPSKPKRPEHNSDTKISAAIKAAQLASLRAAKVQWRTPEQWWKEYEKAMAEKRRAQSKEADE
jgi:hypothetical protein